MYWKPASSAICLMNLLRNPGILPATFTMEHKHDEWSTNMTNETVRVWDIAVRVFHWSLVGFFAIAYVTGEEDNLVHIYSSYAVMGLVLFRILWGLIGTRYARFSDFLYSSRVVADYLKSLTTRTPQRYIGHTPPGGWMIMALLASLLITSMTGLQVYGLEGYGPLAGKEQSISIVSTAYADSGNREGRGWDAHEHDDEENESEESLWEEIHEFFANFTLFLVFVHIAGVVVSSRLHRENLVKAMITGRKEALARGGDQSE
jgi:cytochrome b